VAVGLERACELRRNDLTAALERKTDVQLRINTALKKKDKRAVTMLRQQLATIDDGTNMAHVKAAKDKHKRARELKLKLQKLNKKRLVEVMGHRSPSRIRDIVKKWVSVEKDLQRKRAGAYAGLKKAVREHCVWGGGGEGL
jgi:hypothetical protein